MSIPQRLNKVLAQAGFGSRRACDDLIKTGRVSVNHSPATLGQKVVTNDLIEVDGKSIDQSRQAATLLIKFNKPRGVPVTKKDHFAPVTVMDYLPPTLQHLYPIGRLDKLSSGLLLFTNNGQLALKLTHPRYEHEKEYAVAFTPVKPMKKSEIDRVVTKLTNTIVDKEAQSKPIAINNFSYNEPKQTGNMTIILQEGKNRQIRRLLEACQLYVTSLERIRIDTITLGTLSPGHYSIIKPHEYTYH